MSTMLIVSCGGIFIGTFSLALITAIMHGFELVITEKMQSIHASAMINAGNSPLKYKAIRSVIEKEFPEVDAISPINSNTLS